MKELLLMSSLDAFAPKIDSVFSRPFSELNVVCIPTAANAYENTDWLAEETAPLKNRAKTFVEFDLLGKSYGDVYAALKNADVIYVTGGNTYYLLEQVRLCDFSGALKQRLQAGAYYIGGSAGAVLACPRIDFIGDMDDPGKANLDTYEGLGLVDCPVMPHIDHEEYGPKTMKVIADLESQGVKIIGLREDQALHVRDNRMEIC